ncbi:hypothetical protein CPC08DRAFT_714401 [Agrocybe pediades]|nr:hypothetical protein CPC08DRAFT_714401 [Agrocybe pediades]
MMTASGPLRPLSFAILLALVSNANAQIGFRRRSTSIGRIVAGCVVGGVFLLFFLCLLCIMMRKRRARARYLRNNPGAPVPGSLTGWSPIYSGGPMSRFGVGGRNTGGSYQQHNSAANGPQTSNYNSNAPVSTPQATTNANPEYPAPNAPLPPPAYGKDANYNGQFNPPPGPPPNGASTSNNAAPPPVPPPAAYTGNGKQNDNDHFVGGFRN